MTTAFQKALKDVDKKQEYLAERNEIATRTKVIERLLGIVGWDVSSTEVDQEKPLPSSTTKDKYLDYALQICGQSKVFIEAKQWSVNLNQEHEDQLLRYVNASITETGGKEPLLGVLTNGCQWQLYLPPNSTHPDLRQFLSFDVIDDSSEMVQRRFTQFLSRQKLSTTKELKNTIRSAERLWKKVLQGEEVMAELTRKWNELVSSPNDQLKLLSSFTRQSKIKAEPEHLKRFQRSSGPLLNSIAAKPLKPVSFKLKGGATSPVKVKNWPDLKQKLCEELYKRSKGKFVKAVMSMNEWKDWFRKTDKKIPGYKPIAKSGISVKTHGSQAEIKRLFPELVTKCNYKEESLTIQYG